MLAKVWKQNLNFKRPVKLFSCLFFDEIGLTFDLEKSCFYELRTKRRGKGLSQVGHYLQPYFFLGKLAFYTVIKKWKMKFKFKLAASFSACSCRPRSFFLQAFCQFVAALEHLNLFSYLSIPHQLRRLRFGFVTSFLTRVCYSRF